MILDKKHLIVFIVGIFLGLFGGFFIGKSLYDKPLDVGIKVERDTILVHDTIPDLNPTPKDSARIKWITRWLPSKRDTSSRVDHFIDTNNMIHDTVLVEVPITSKHYSSPQYDAYVSGFEPSLDSIFVYQEKEYINTTITKTIKESKHLFLNVAGGTEYKVNDKQFVPFAEFGIKFKKDRFGIGVSGGYQHNVEKNTGEPYVRAKASWDIFSF